LELFLKTHQNTPHSLITSLLFSL
jgi:hypothetical protein